MGFISLFFSLLYSRFEKQSSNRTLIRNDAGERIQTLDFTVPVLHAAVLSYKAGELQSANPEISGRDFRLWYPPEEVSAKTFLESIRKAPISVGSHEKNTSEFNVDVNGWPTTVRYDETRKAAIIDGVVKKAENVEYVRRLAKTNNFGASGFIDAQDIEIKSGTTPEGEPFDGIARKLICTHIALLPNVRDPDNKIITKNAKVVVMNSITINKNDENALTDSPEYDEAQTSTIEAKNAGGKMAKNEDEKGGDLKNEIRNVLDEMKKDEAGASKMAELEKTVNAMGEKLAAYDAKNGVKNAEEEKKPEGEAENAEDKKEDGETLNAKNARPTQENIKLLGEHFGIDFGRSTPTFNALAPLIGAEGKTLPEIITAVNAKAVEIKNSKSNETNMVNSKPTGGFDAYLGSLKVGN